MSAKNYPLVSIAIITYNQREFLRECLESCLSQDYPNIEIVVADDASTDGTRALLGEYKRRYPDEFVLCLSEANQGITKNTNLAYFACKGKYIAFMGGDDLMLPGKIALQVEVMEKKPEVVISYHNLDVFDSDSGEVTKKLNEKDSYSGYLNGYIRRGCVNGASATMIRSQCAPTGGFSEVLPVASDWFFWCEVLAGSKGKIEYIENTLGKYRRHQKNVTTGGSSFAAQGSLDTLVSCILIASKYPPFTRSANYRLGALLRGMRRDGNYTHRLLSSLSVSFQLRTLILLIINGITLGRVKL